MKRIILLLSLSVIMTATYSQQTYQVNNNRVVKERSFSADISSVNQEGFSIELNNPQQKKLNVWVRHAVLGTISDTTISSRKITCHYNLENIDDGKYIITISDGRDKYIKELEMTTVTTVSRNITVL